MIGDILAEVYLWTKAFHIMSVIAWMAGIFYLPRLFVYHVENKDKQDSVSMLKTMERKLYFYITTPAMIATIVFGMGTLINSAHNLKLPWMHIKLTLLLGLIIYHFYIGYTLKRFKDDDIFLSSKQCRLLNEVPTLFLLGIIFIAVFRGSIG